MGEFDMYRQAGTTPNFTDIARRYGMNRHTVAKYWKAGGQVEDARRCRPSGLDRHREVIEAKAQLPGATKRGIYEYLIDRCYAGEEPPAYNTLTKWMRRNGIECGRPPEGPEPHPRFETAPGEQMQFDWKESLRMADAEGEVFEFNVFSATLGYSRLHRFVYSRTRTEDDVMACLLAVMAANGGTARTLVTDNMSSIVSSSASGRRVSARFARFAAAAGFELELARPRSPQTKGKVESSNRFLSRLAVYEGDFRGEEGLVAAIARIEARCNTEPSASTGVPPAVLFMREKEELRKVGNMGLLESMVADVSVQAVPPHDARPLPGPRVLGAPALHRQARQGARDAVGPGEGGDGRRDRRGPRPVGPGRARRLRPGALRRGPGREGALRRRRHRGGGPRQPGAARQARGGVAVSARDEGGAYARIRENLSELGLDAMAAGLPHWMSAVAAGEADFASAMLAMTSEEAEAKRRRGTDRKVRAAGFPFVKTLADFDFSFQPSIPRAVVDDLATLRFLDAAENVVLVGSPGVGKTHIAVALGVEAVRARKEVRFTDCAALVRDLKDASSRGILAKRLKYYAHASLLIIDELGYLDVDEEGADLLFQLVSARYEHRSTVITTNVAVGLWADVFGDAVTAAAIADRVCHHCTMLKITGRSYRMKDLLAEAADGDGLPERGQS